MRHRQDWHKDIGLFASLFVLAAMLPVLITGVANIENLRLLINAKQPEELNIWFEPSSIVTHPGVKFKVKVMAQYNDQRNYVPKVVGNVAGSTELEVEPLKVDWQVPFTGKQELGELTVTANSAGNFKLTLPANGVFTQIASLNINTAQAEIISRP
jgi:hypothetical protein